ncbi:MAG: hypothetical protein V3U87_10210 [Methylococcaceae bacterium]
MKIKTEFVLEPNDSRIEKELYYVLMVGDSFSINKENYKVDSRDFDIDNNKVTLWCSLE